MLGVRCGVEVDKVELHDLHKIESSVVCVIVESRLHVVVCSSMNQVLFRHIPPTHIHTNWTDAVGEDLISEDHIDHM